MHKSISAQNGPRFSWRAFFFGVLTVFVPMILLVLLLFGGVVLSWEQSRAQRAQAVLSRDQAERIAISAQEALRRRQPSIIASEPYFTEPQEAVIDESTAPMAIPDAPDAPVKTKPMMEGLFGGSKPPQQVNNDQRILELMEQLVEQQQRQQQFLERQAQYNEEMLHLMRKSLEAASNNGNQGGVIESLPAAEPAEPLNNLDAGGLDKPSLEAGGGLNKPNLEAAGGVNKPSLDAGGGLNEPSLGAGGGLKKPQPEAPGSGRF